MNPKNKTTTTTTTTQRVLTDRVTRTLTREEELVVRLRRGLGESGSYPLEFRGESHPETAAQLALIEAALLAEMFDTGPLAEVVEEGAQVNAVSKSKILDKLSKLSD